MKITLLGTGNALVTECYNTCFVLSDGEKHLLVDGGGGSQVLRQLKEAGYDYLNLHEIFVTHKHIDHLLGIVWIVRVVCQAMAAGKYDGDCNIYAHDEVIGLILDMSDKLLTAKQSRFIGERLHLVEVTDGEKRDINGHQVTFFDIGSTKAKQFGFCMDMGNGEKLTCCGDEPYNEREKTYAENSKWLLHEAFCLYEQADEFHPYEKHHSTVRDAGELAEKLHVQNLILYHTEDKNIKRRKELYTAEGKRYFHGNVFVPEDLEVIEL